MLTQIKSIRMLLLGLASWAIPFVVSIAFFDRSGTLAIALPLFKSIMVVVGGGVGAALFVFAFRHVTPTLKTGLSLGFLWLAINYALDIAILIPMSGDSFGGWFQSIGLRYLMIPIMGATIGTVAARSE